MSGGQPTKGAVNIVDIVDMSGGPPTKGAVNIVDIVGVCHGRGYVRAVCRCISAGVGADMPWPVPRGVRT